MTRPTAGTHDFLSQSSARSAAVLFHGTTPRRNGQAVARSDSSMPCRAKKRISLECCQTPVKTHPPEDLAAHVLLLHEGPSPLIPPIFPLDPPNRPPSLPSAPLFPQSIRDPQDLPHSELPASPLRPHALDARDLRPFRSLSFLRDEPGPSSEVHSRRFELACSSGR